MRVVPFDTLKLAHGLEAAGLSPAHAAGSSAALAEAIGDMDLVTRGDLDHGLNSLRLEVKADLAALEQRLTTRLGAMIVAALGVLTAIIHYVR